MDLKDLTPKTDEIVVIIKHPVSGEVLKNDDSSDMVITVYAPHSKEYKKVQRDIVGKRLKAAQESGSKDIDYEKLEEATMDLLIRTTKSWDITYDGNKPELTEDKSRQIYDEVFWIKNQIDDALNNSLDFMKA